MKRKKSCIRGNVRNQLEPPRRIPFHSLSHKGDFSFCLSFSFELFCNRFYLCLIRSGSFCKMPLKMNYWWITFFLLLWILVPQKNCIFLTALSFTSIFLNTFSMHLGARKVALRFWWPQNTGKLKKKKNVFFRRRHSSKLILSISPSPWLACILHRRVFEKENNYLGSEGFAVAVAGTTGSQPVWTFSQIYSIKLLYHNEPPGSWTNQWTNCPTSCLRLSWISLSLLQDP